MAESDFRYPVALAPLDYSHRDNQFEADLYQMFMDLYEDYLRVDERDLNVSAVPHLGSFDLVSRNVEMDGLALINNDDEPAMRYLHKAWKHRNPKRGLEFLETYLQLLFPNSWKVNQLWHPKDSQEQYPIDVATRKESIDGESFLTSRIRVSIYGAVDDKDYLSRITPAIRSVLPARLLLEVTGLSLNKNNMVLANAWEAYGNNKKEIKPRVSLSTSTDIRIASLISMTQRATESMRPRYQIDETITHTVTSASLLGVAGNVTETIEPIAT